MCGASQSQKQLKFEAVDHRLVGTLRLLNGRLRVRNRILCAVRALAVLNQLDERILLHIRHIENERLAAAIVAAA